MRKLFPIVILAVMAVLPMQAKALNSAEIAASSFSSSCLDYEIVGICIWLRCNWRGCRIRTSLKVKHYIPELVVSTYEQRDGNPWTEARMLLSQIALTASEGGRDSNRHAYSQDNTRFKFADAIGHPGVFVFNQFASGMGFTCSSPAVPMRPYTLSNLNPVAWRFGVPEMVHPDALIPGRRELGQPGDLWGNIYPRTGFINHVHDYKVAAVAAQRTADIVTRLNQPHVYTPLHANSRDGYWPPGPVLENTNNHKWQMLAPRRENSCSRWPDRDAANTYADKLDERGNYAFALWRPYECCQRRGQWLLAH